VILATRRALLLGAAVALLALLGYWVSWAPQLLLAVNALLVALVWLDARNAPSPVADPRPQPAAAGTAAWWLRFALLLLSWLALLLVLTAALELAVPVVLVLVIDLALAAWLARFFGALLDRRRPGADIVVERSAAAAFSIGHTASVEYRWRNGAPRAARLRVREVRPELLGGLQSPRRVTVPPHGVTRETYAVAPARRGRTAAGSFVIDSTGPLGLGVRRGWLELPWSVVVYPPMVSMRLRASVAQSLRRRELGRRAERQLGEGRLFESLREWVPGDDPRHIDWKATARRHKVMTRQYEAERRQQVLLVMDTGRLLTADVGGVARLDYAVQAALELAYAAAQYDDNVGVMAFADGVQHFVPPLRGHTGLKQVLDVLAVLEPKLVEPDYPGAFRYLAVRNRKRALTVVFTDVIDRFASEALVANVATLRPRHLPLAVTLRNPELDALAALRPATTGDAYRKAAAEELLRARDEALGYMRRSGVMVIDVPPARAAQAVVQRYLELKRHGRM
jgi:uncharacterized protein (DUF58 family)